MNPASAGFDKETRQAFGDAYLASMIVVCAAGQVIDRVIYPARYKNTIAVGGIRQDGVRHYPNDNYDIPERVDIRAQADGINRAIFYLEDGEPRFEYSGDEDDISTDDVSGTSYAAPQVAAAAALWVESYFHGLPQPGDIDAWKTVEALHTALTDSARQVGLKIPGTGRMVVRPRLEIDQPLNRTPELPAQPSSVIPSGRLGGWAGRRAGRRSAESASFRLGAKKTRREVLESRPARLRIIASQNRGRGRRA